MKITLDPGHGPFGNPGVLAGYYEGTRVYMLANILKEELEMYKDTEAFEAGRAYIMKLAYANEVSVLDTVPADAESMVTATTDNARMFMPMADLVDLEKERARLQKELANAEKQLQAQVGKLSNENFVTRAPEAVVNIEREKKAKLEALIENLKQNLSHLS